MAQRFRSRTGHSTVPSSCSHTVSLMPVSWPTILIIALSALFVADASIEGLVRTRRQSGTPVSSSGNVNATGNKTDMTASNAMWKTPDGVIGANGSSTGNAGGPGSSGVLTGSNANVGNQGAGGTNAAESKGQQSMSSGSSLSSLLISVNGGQQNQSGSATGAAYGMGNTRVDSLGRGTVTNGNQTLSSGALATGGATGNQFSAVNTSEVQKLAMGGTWSILFSRISGSSISKGENNSQANFNGRAGTNTTKIAIDSLVSGVNDKTGGGSLSYVSGTGTLDNNKAAMGSELAGGINSTSGGSRLVGASNLESMGVNGSTINTFGDLRMNGTGAGMGGLLANSSANPDGKSKGGVAVQGTETGANKSVSASNGIRAIDPGAPSIASVGRGNLEGTGNMAANGTSYVLSGYETGKGPAQLVGSYGESKANNNTGSALNIANTGNVFTGNQTTTNASSNAMGKSFGQNSGVVGGSFLNLTKQQQAGNSNVFAQGSGADIPNGPQISAHHWGSSGALTEAKMALNGPNNTVRNSNIKGEVEAKGDWSSANSTSQVADQNGKQSAYNSQNAAVKSAGSGAAQARNSAVMKRRRRDTADLEALKEAVAKFLGKETRTKRK